MLAAAARGVHGRERGDWKKESTMQHHRLSPHVPRRVSSSMLFFEHYRFEDEELLHRCSFHRKVPSDVSDCQGSCAANTGHGSSLLNDSES